jgi:hypothetical protein
LTVRVNRAINLVVATLYIPYSMFNGVGESRLYFYVGGALEVIVLALIVRYAWTWPRRPASPVTRATSLDNEPLRTLQQA